MTTSHVRGVVVYGVPKPKGSKRHVGNGILVESAGQPLRDWANAVTAAARLERERPGVTTITDPVAVTVDYRLPRPKNNPKGRHTLPSRKPDLDKLDRAVLDALVVAAVMGDDSLVVDLHSSKRYADRDDPWTGCVVRLHVYEGMGP